MKEALSNLERPVHTTVPHNPFNILRKLYLYLTSKNEKKLDRHYID
jgi:hypothetical protein